MKNASTLLLAALSLAASAAIAIAQDANTPRDQERRDRGDRGDRGDRRGGNFEEFRQRMNERLKASLKATDEEWTVIQPLIEKVQAKQREGMGGRFGGRGPGGGGPGAGGSPQGGGDGERRDRGGSPEGQALRAALENENSSPEELKAKLNAVREARKKSAAELAQAREELRGVLSVRQEAALVAAGILE